MPISRRDFSSFAFLEFREDNNGDISNGSMGAIIAYMLWPSLARLDIAPRHEDMISEAVQPITAAFILLLSLWEREQTTLGFESYSFKNGQ
jgi:hypothetical protein